MAKQDVKAGGAYVELFTKDGKLIKGLSSASRRLQSWSRSALLIGGAVSAAGSALLAPITAAVAKFTGVGDALDKMAGRTGASVEFLSEVGFAMQQGGSDAAALEKSLRRMTAAVYDANRGLAETTDAFAEMGLTAEDLQGLTVDQQFERITAALAGVQDASTKAALAQRIFGRSGTALLPMLRDGAEGLRQLRQEARDLGLTKTVEETNAAAAIADAINRVRQAVGATIFRLGAQLAEPLLQVLETLKNLAVAAGKWTQENAGLVRTIAAVAGGLLGAGAAITAVGLALGGVGLGLGAIAGVLTTIGAAVGFVLTPLGALGAALAAGAVAWAGWTESGQRAVRILRATFGQILQAARDTVGGIMDALLAGDLALAGQIAITGLRVVVMTGLAGLADLVSGVWGATVASIGNSLLAGDVQGAWQAGVQGLSAAWRQFASWVVQVTAAMTKKVVELWSKSVGGIAKGLLAAASKDTLTGRLFSKILGVDVRAEVEQAKKLNEQLGINEDPLEAAFAGIDRDMAAIRDRADTALDALQLRFEEAADDAARAVGEATAPGAEALERRLAEEKARLDELTRKAAEAGEKRRREIADRLGGALPGAAEPIARAQSVAGTFSSAALGALARGGAADPVRKLVGEAEKNRKAAEKAVDHLANLDRRGGPQFG